MRRCPGLRFEPVKLSNIYHGLFALDRVVFQVTHRDQGPLGVVQVELNDECHLRGTRASLCIQQSPIRQGYTSPSRPAHPGNSAGTVVVCL